MNKWEVGRYTLTQLLNALNFADPTDPHAGNIPVSSVEELRGLADDHGFQF